MHNGNLAKVIFYSLVAVGLGFRAFLAGILFTAVIELQTPSLRVAVWVIAMLITFGIIFKIYQLVRFTRKNLANW